MLKVLSANGLLIYCFQFLSYLGQTPNLSTELIGNLIRSARGNLDLQNGEDVQSLLAALAKIATEWEPEPSTATQSTSTSAGTGSSPTSPGLITTSGCSTEASSLSLALLLFFTIVARIN